jgi:hypothetical protein
VLTVFAVPKPFKGQVGTIQRNAIRSWAALDPKCEVIICGDEAGSRDIVSELDLVHIPDVECSDFGTPLLSSVFQQVEAQATHDRLCYANADLILFSSFLDALGRVEAAFSPSLVVGETTNLEVAEELTEDRDFQAVHRRALTSGQVRGPLWIDFFVFHRGSIGRLPDFVVGRPCWDNWMIWNARKLRLPIVDMSPKTMVVHQSHEYWHVKESTGPRWEGPEADWNRELLGVPERLFTLDEATHRLTDAGVVPVRPGLMHRIGTEILLHRGTTHLYRLLRAAYEHARLAVSHIWGGPGGLGVNRAVLTAMQSSRRRSVSPLLGRIRPGLRRNPRQRQ